jgi:thioredoxin 1
MIIELSENNRQLIFESDKIVILFFNMPHDGPCIAMIPVMDYIDKKYHDEILVVKINVNDNSYEELLFDYYVRAAPTLVILKNGEVIFKRPGYTDKITLEKILDENL